MRVVKRIAWLALKDIKDAIRDARVLVALIVPIGIGIFYGFLFDDAPANAITANLAIVSPDGTAFVEHLKSALPSSVSLKIVRYDDQASLTTHVGSGDQDLGIVLPAGFDAALANGAKPLLTVVQAADGSVAADYLAAAIDPALRSMVGQPFPAEIKVVTASDDASGNIVSRIGLRTWSILISIILSIALVAILAIPIVLVEEVEKRTLDALILAMNYWEIVSAKTLLGLTYASLMTAILILLTRIHILHWPLFVAATLLTAISLLGIGLLLAGIFKSANQLNTWSGLLLTPVIIPTFLIGNPVPQWAQTAASLFPTGAGMHLLVNSVSQKPVFDYQARLFATLLVWIVVIYGLLIRRLNRYEA